jgi:Ni,Fe-hydrogenase maturation factor
MDVRTCYAHLFDNKTHNTNIPSIIDLLKNQNPILELQKVTLMLKVIKVVMDFMKDVMEELSTRAHKASEKSTEELRNIILKIKDVTEQPNCPVELKELLYNMIGKVQGWTGIEL